MTQIATQTVEDVRTFWESNPLWTGESRHAPGERAFFEEHRSVFINDCLAGRFDSRFIPPPGNRDAVLDLGCGPGFWVIELSKYAKTITGADLTQNALNLTRERCNIYNVQATLSQQNAETMSFEDGSFSHVNCQGVIHHTPNTPACVREIARVLRSGGTASVSVYYKNIFLRAWPLLNGIGKLLHRLGARLPGRGRENIFALNDVDEIVRLYDGLENPIGKAYSRSEFITMLSPYFDVEETYLHFFPARTLPFPVPGWLHRLLDRHAGFMIYATLRKKTNP